MIVYDILDVLEDLQDDQREIILAGLLSELTQISNYVLMEMQLEWDGNKSYEDFVTYQNRLLKECIQIEMSPFGRMLRKMEGLPPLTLRTEVHL